MFPFLVLVSRHFWDDKHTTQLTIPTYAEDRDGARATVVVLYPPIYMRFWEQGKYIGICAHYSGEIFSA